ncbi:MAG: DedA family protein [Dehalococcoidia bacterium]|nr:DedA family protein [Dehalococcoidia bacterium]
MLEERSKRGTERMPFDFNDWIQAAGYPGMAAAIFAETGLLIGFFLPGDTLLLSAGFLAQRGHFSLWILVPVLCIAAVLGDSTGYYIGERTGPKIFRKEGGRFFKRSHLLRARRFYQKHGGKTIFIARFIGYIRTFAPTVAGAAGMPYLRFLSFNLAGGVTWVVSLLFVGYFVGTQVESLELYMAVIFGSAIALTLLAAGGRFAWKWLRKRKARHAATVR